MKSSVNIPHEPPMHWLDSASITDDGLQARATRHIGPEHPFVRDGQLLPSALIELMAQAAAAGSAIKAAREHKKIRRGVLVGIRDFRTEGAVAVGVTIELTALHEKTLGALSMGRMEARVNGQLIASARMTFHLDFE